MLNIFYQNKSLNDTLIVNASLARPTRVQTKGDVTVGYSDNVPVFANIRNASHKIDSKLLADGLLFPTKELLNYILTLTKIDFSPCFDNGFKVGIVEQCDAIQGTHLHKCIVSIGAEQLNIICGAKNVKQGLKVVVATNGTMLPSAKQIIAGELLGYKSEGMLCSYRELGIQQEANGIIELDNSYPSGSYFLEPYANCKK